MGMGPTMRLPASAVKAHQPLAGDAFDDAVQSFTLLSSFFSEVDFQGIYPVSQHGPDYPTACKYLSSGFDDSLVAAILHTYTFTDPNGMLMIVPCEGIPHLISTDRAKATIITRPDQTIIQLPLKDCYQSGDQYIYQITSRLTDQQWKITALSFEEQSGGQVP